MDKTPLQIGWGQTEITPEGPVFIAGQFYTRISEGVADPLMAIALALDTGEDHVIFVSVDSVGISDAVRDAVRARLDGETFDPRKVLFHATHSHAAPESRFSNGGLRESAREIGHRKLEAMPVDQVVEFMAGRIAAMIRKAWAGRAPGGIAFGIDDAVVGRNRRWVNDQGISTMYRLFPPQTETFRHVEGFEDHSLNLLATYDPQGKLTGVLVNIPSPSQQSEHSFLLSADFWAETRAELRKRFGEGLGVISQCSAAGDLTGRTILEPAARARMLKLRGIDDRQEIANRITEAVARILPVIASTVDYAPELRHRVEMLELPVNRLSQADADDAARNAAAMEEQYQAEVARLNDAASADPRWYLRASEFQRRKTWYQGVIQRFQEQKTCSTKPFEVHFLRLGEIAFASNPFEYYLDFGIQIKVRSPALQTFLIQLAGNGTYVPSPRSVQGGGYGSVPASNPIGPEGGQALAEHTVTTLRELFNDCPSQP